MHYYENVTKKYSNLTKETAVINNYYIPILIIVLPLFTK